MLPVLSAVGSLLSFQVRSRAALELELVALRHQVTVLRRQRPGQALSRWQSSPPNSDRFASWRFSISNDLAGSGRGQKWLTSANVTMP